jgi:hypothetical protein
LRALSGIVTETLAVEAFFAEAVKVAILVLLRHLFIPLLAIINLPVLCACCPHFLPCLNPPDVHGIDLGEVGGHCEVDELHRFAFEIDNTLLKALEVRYA